MDPVGPQKKIKSNEYHPGFQKLLDSGGSKSTYPDGLNKESGSHKTSKARDYEEWQGTTKGDTKHTFGVKGNLGVRKNG